MKMQFTAVSSLFCLSFLLGCGGGGTPPAGGGGGTSVATLYLSVGFTGADSLFHTDTTNPTGRGALGNGVFSQNNTNIYATYNNVGTFGLLGGNGSYYFTTPNTFSASNPLLIEFAIPFTGDLECPASSATATNGVANWANESYSSNGQSKTVSCLPAYPYYVHPLSVDPTNPISFITMGVPNPIDTTYGMPVITYYDTAGNYLGSEVAASVSADGLTITIPTDLIMNFGNGDILVAASQVNGDQSLTPEGGGVLSIYTSTPPGDPGDPGGPGNGGGCYSNNCIAQDNPN